MKWAFISLLLLLMVTSCTITKQRYSRGYHIEWNKRKVVSYADKVSENSAFETQKTAILPDKAVVEIKSNDTLNEVNTGITEWYERREVRPFASKKVAEAPAKSVGVVPVDRSFSKMTQNDGFQQSERAHSGQSMSDLGESLSDFFFVFCIILMLLVIPPLLHTLLVASFYHFKNDTLFLVLEWLIWGAGIVAIIVFFSSALTIVLTCLGWNLLFALFVSAIILNQ